MFDKCKGLFLPFLLSFQPIFVFGQSVQEFKEIWVNESKEFLLNNQKPLPYLQSGFHHFSREQDNALANGLESEWIKFSVLPGNPVSKSRKFDSTPQFNFEETSNHNPQFLPFYAAEQTDLDKQSVNPPRIRKPEYTSSSPLKLSFKFYGNNVVVTYDKLLSLPVNQPVSKEIAIDYWKKFTVSNSNHLVNQLMICRDRLGLNDWGYLSLVKTCCKAIYPRDESGYTLLSWALMIRSGYDVKIGFNQLGSSVLYTTTPEIYGIPSIKVNGFTYYIDKPIYSFPITSYVPGHPGATRSVCLNFNQSLNFQGEVLHKKIQFPGDKRLYEFNLKYNPEVIRFLEDYPQTDPEIFFNAPFSFLSWESLFKQFRPVLASMSKEQGVAFLQRFVQKMFLYRPYNDIYGYDRFMFPEELLFKEESNDKGKALLFSWMISNLLNQNAALVEFPGFYSVAVSLGQPLEGDNYLINGKSYTIADPTFENAPIGLIMKEFYQQKPLIRELKNFRNEENEKIKIWKLATAMGAERSGSEDDFIKDESGNSYITGYFKEKIHDHISAVPAPFIAKFNAGNSLIWMVKFKTSGKAFGLELKQLDRNELYLAGSFRGELECNGSKIQSSQAEPDLFFAQFDRNGKIDWMTKSGLDDLEEDTGLFYSVRFSRSGEIQSVQLSNEDERTGKTGFQQFSNEGLCYVASRYQTSGLDRPSEEAIKKSPVRFRQDLNRMRQLGFEPSVSGLASLFNSLISPGDQLSGSDLASFSRDKIQSESSGLSNLTQLVQKIKLIKNDDGIVEVSTADSKPLKILSFKILEHSHLKIVPLDNNDLKIKVIDGIDYESDVFNEKINFILVDLASGSIIIDFGPDHHVVTKNLKH